MSDPSSSGIAESRITGLVLAGGRGRRMSADGRGVNKGLQGFRGRPLVDHVIERLQGQVSSLLINANDSQAEYARRGFPVVGDEHTGYQGPLAGLYAGLKACETPWLLMVPCDSPFLALDLASRLGQAAAAAGADAAIASSGGRQQPVFALVCRRLADDLQSFLARGDRKIDLWLATLRTVVVEFDDTDAFLNFNTLEELREHDR